MPNQDRILRYLICDDEHNYVMFSCDWNSCIRNHWRYALCGFHYLEEHDGDWKDCAKGREEFETEILVGADECLPTVAQCEWRGLKLPDHGEAWTEAWQLDEEALARNVITVSLDLPISPLCINRSMRLEGSRVQFDYTLTNESDGPFEYIWALHPMMAIEKGDQLVLPAECEIMRTDATVINCDLGDRGTVFKWPSPAAGIHLDQLVLGPDSAAAKLFTEPLSLGRAALRNRNSGDYIAYACDVNELDTFGIWINRGGWDGYQHVAIEPTNGAPDPLDLAVKDWNRYSVLDAGESRSWGLNIHVGVDKDSEGDCFLETCSI